MKQQLKNIIFSPTFILGSGLLLLFVFGIYPFIVLIQKIIFSKDGFTLAPFIKAFSNKSTLVAMKNTMIVSFGTSILSLIFALPIAWVLTRSDLPNKGRWKTFFSLPYAIPPYIGAMAWITLANPTNGHLNIIFGDGFFNVYTLPGLIWVMSSFFYTFILLSLLAALDRMDPSLEEAARLSGASNFRVFKDITIPIIFPALLSGVLLVFLAAAASFGVPALIGVPAGLFLMTTKIYTYQKMGGISGLIMSGALSVILLLLAIFILVINAKILKKRSFQVIGGKTSRQSLFPLGNWKYWVQFKLTIFLLVIFIFPLSGILITALNKVQGVYSWSNLGLQNFNKVFFEVPETYRALGNSLKLALAAGIVSTILGVLLAYIQKKTKLRGRSSIEVLASIPYSVPGTVVALSLIIAFSSGIFGLPIPLYNTLGLIFLAYTVKYLNFSLRTTGDGLAQIDDCLGEAARVAGASWFTSFKTIWLPLLRPALMASFFLVFMPSFSELTMTILLTGPGLETLGTLIFQLQEYSDASGGGAAVLAIMTVFMVIAINGFVKLVSKGKYGL